MIYNVLLVSEQKLKDSTPITENVQSSELRYGLTTAQNIFLQESLGTNLFEHILKLVQDGTIDQAGNIKYKELLNNFIQPMLIAYAWYLIMDNLYIKAVNIGLQNFSSEQSSSIGIKELTYLKDNAKNVAEFQDNLLRRHLVFNNQDYPQYTLTTNNGQLIPEFAGAFRSSITLPTTRYVNGSLGPSGWGGSYGVNPWLDCPYPWWYSGNNSRNIP
jgi:hypothetical protein